VKYGVRISVTNAAIGVIAGVTLVYAVLNHYQAPYFDHWDIAPLLEADDSGTLTLARLFEIHGGHWHASAYALLVPLARLTAWSHLAESLASFAFMAATAMLALRLGTKFASVAAPNSRNVSLVLGTAFIAFSLDQASNLLWGFPVAVFMNVFGGVLMIMALTGPTLSLAAFAMAATGVCLSVFAYGAGFALMPIGAVLIALNGASRTRRLAFGLTWVALCTGLCLAFVQALERAPMGGGFDASDLARADFLPYLGFFTLNFVGAGVARFTSDLVIAVALIGIVAASGAVFILRRRGVTWANLATPLALCAFGIGAALLCGLGRYDFGAEQGASSRYISLSTPFWLGALWLVLAALQHVHDRSARAGIIALLAVLAVLKLGNSIQSAVKHVSLSRQVAEIAETMRAEPDNAAVAARQISFERQDIVRHVTFLRDRRWSMLATSARRSLQPPPSPD
jgi:hypothetical protein